MNMSLNQTQIASLDKAGLSKTQITQLADTIKEVESLTANDIDTLVNKISTDQEFQRDFFKDPMSAMEKVGIKARVGTNPATGEKIVLEARVGTNPSTGEKVERE